MVKALSVAVSTGLCVAVWSAHAAGVAVLVWLFDGAIPPTQQIIGTCILVVGIAMCHAHEASEGAVARIAGRGRGACREDTKQFDMSEDGRVEILDVDLEVVQEK
mmetsp:Transcript_3925/g.9537  ORF Transcript_3925/g.9537 Transcript_3925/m.9537 type:complete len:105 (+) Transcript_3925:478-792(+)